MLLVGTSNWSFLVDRPILKFFGFISYGLYLVHILAYHMPDILLSHQLATLIANGRPVYCHSYALQRRSSTGNRDRVSLQTLTGGERFADWLQFKTHTFSFRWIGIC